MRILILAALPQETAPFRRHMETRRRAALHGFKAWRGSVSGKEIFLVETGMGADALSRAFHAAMEGFRPDAVVSAGFCGALDDGLQVGRVIAAEEVILFREDSGDPGSDPVSIAAPVAFRERMKSRGVAGATVVTVRKPVDKLELARRKRGTDPWVVDMETHVAASLAMERSVPFLGMRSVSDGLRDGIGFDLERVTDASGNVRISRVLLLVLRRPALVRCLFRHWRRSVRAARSLDEELRAFLGIDDAGFRALIGRSGRVQ